MRVGANIYLWENEINEIYIIPDNERLYPGEYSTDGVDRDLRRIFSPKLDMKNYHCNIECATR